MRTLILPFDIFGECRKYNIPLWQCPQFLFLMMGSLIIISSLFSYVLGTKYIEDPQITTLFILFLTGILLAITFVITRSFERLAEANRLKSEFISIVSHQLRSPLTNVKWGLDFLREEGGKRTEQEGEYFDIIRENTRRMEELVEDLLTVSRIQQGSLPFQKKEFSFEELLRTVLSEFQSFINASNIEVKIEGEKMAQIVTDPSLVRHIVANLLDNAIRYAWQESSQDSRERKENRKILVRYRQLDDLLQVEVQDNGIGIPQEDQRFIFQKFFRSSNAVRRQTQGSGLGLYIVKSLLEKMGGTIGFASEENKGSTFWFTIPTAKQ